MFRGTHETIFRFFASAKTCKICLLGAAPIPRQGPLTLPCERSTGGVATRSCGRCWMGDLTIWKEVCPQRPAGRAAAPLGDEKGRRWRPFFGVWVLLLPNKRFAGVYILLPCLPRMFLVGLRFPPRTGLHRLPMKRFAAL